MFISRNFLETLHSSLSTGYFQERSFALSR